MAELNGGKKPFREWAKEVINEELKAKVKDTFASRIKDVASQGWTKNKRKEGFDLLKAELKTMIADMEEEDQKKAKKYFLTKLGIQR